MKTAIFAEPGKMVIKEAAKPTLQADDDVIIRVIRTCVCGSDLWAYSAGDQKANDSVTAVTKRLGSLKRSAVRLQRSSQVILLLLHSRMAVDIVLPVWPAMMAPATSGSFMITGVKVSNPNIFALSMATGL